MSFQYDEYLFEHRANVMHAFWWLFNNGLIDDSENFGEYVILYNMRQHDASKNDIDEYRAYDSYFYGDNSDENVAKDFDYAWLHHIHNNPHHWQHWVLFEDEGTVKALEMPYEHMIEMICDWWSFSFKSGNLYEIIDWYEDHKDKMILHENTRKAVEDILKKIKDTLDLRMEEFYDEQ